MPLQHVQTVRTDWSYDNDYKQVLRADKLIAVFCRSSCVLSNAPAINGITMLTVDDLIEYQSFLRWSCSMSSSVQWLDLVSSIGFFGSWNVTGAQRLPRLARSY
jgi:hypothetical protein